MQVETEIVNGGGAAQIHLLRFDGRLSLGQGTELLRNAVRDIIAKEPQPKIAIDFSNIHYIDSSGIGELVSSFTTINNQGGKLIFFGATKSIIELMYITKLITLLIFVDDEKIALARLRAT